MKTQNILVTYTFPSGESVPIIFSFEKWDMLLKIAGTFEILAQHLMSPTANPSGVAPQNVDIDLYEDAEIILTEAEPGSMWHTLGFNQPIVVGTFIKNLEKLEKLV
jgi:hypothetical protein